MLELNGFKGSAISLENVVSCLTKAQREKLAEGYDLKRLAIIFEDGDMVATCNSLFENNLNVSLTSRKMYMHRNTLIYRLNKIKKITGLDVCNFAHAVTFLILYSMYFAK
jgi:DNA-binding PucR family transcriptional regulator